MFVDPSLALSHCRLDSDDEVDLVALYLGAAEDASVAYLNRNVYATQDDLDAAVTAETAGDNPMVVNNAIKAAILLTVGHLYANREDVVRGVVAQQLPMGARDLLRPWRIIPGV